MMENIKGKRAIIKGVGISFLILREVDEKGNVVMYNDSLREKGVWSTREIRTEHRDNIISIFENGKS